MAAEEAPARLVIRELLKRMVKQFEDLIIHGSEFSDATRRLAKAFGGWASGGLIQPTLEMPKPNLPGEFVVPPRFFGVDRSSGPDHSAEVSGIIGSDGKPVILDVRIHPR